MGRDVVSVVLGGAGTTQAAPAGDAAVFEGEVTTANMDSVVQSLKEAKNIIITPGYGLAVAQAQFAIAEIAKKLKADGKNVRFGIHPVSVSRLMIEPTASSALQPETFRYSDDTFLTGLL